MSGRRILVVDDEPDTRRLVRIALERRGYLVADASNGEDAFDLAKSEPFDLVLLDIMMPRVSGYEVFQRLRAHPATRAVKVVFLTAKGQVDEVDYGFALGAEGYIVKPFSVKDLVQVVAEAIGSPAAEK